MGVNGADEVRVNTEAQPASKRGMRLVHIDEQCLAPPARGDTNGDLGRSRTGGTTNGDDASEFCRVSLIEIDDLSCKAIVHIIDRASPSNNIDQFFGRETRRGDMLDSQPLEVGLPVPISLKGVIETHDDSAALTGLHHKRCRQPTRVVVDDEQLR